MSVEVAIKHAAKTTGEGPHWDEETQTLLYVDIVEGDVHRWNPSTAVNQTIHIGGNVTLIVPCVNGGYVISKDRSLCHLDWETETVTTLHTVEDEKDNRFNDGKCDRNGRLWAGTMGLEYVDRLQEKQGTLYSVDSGGVRPHVKQVSVSNGLAWTADNKTMYYVDSPVLKIYAYDYDAEAGQISNRRVVVDVANGYPDGMTIDTEGKLWVACFAAGRVVRYDPKTGKELRVIEIPSLRTTSCCFGGKDLDELYVTSCAKHVHNGLTLEEVYKQEPLAGSVFRVTGLGVKGYAANKFNG